MSAPVYSDSLVELTAATLTLKNYYFPTRGAKVIKLTDIQEVVEKENTLFNGKGRIWGTGNFRIWFACDFHRPQRDVIYRVRYKNAWIQSGFTVEDSAAFSAALAQTGLLRR
jgi:hypothetical protein